MKNLFASILACAAILAASSAAAQTPPDVVCRAARTVAASYWGEWQSLDGAGEVVQYPNKLYSIGGAFDTIHFTAPCSGVYTFTVSFVRDEDVNTRCLTQGTADDVYVQFWLTPAAGGSDRRLGSAKGAWAGQTPTSVARATGTDTIAVRLEQNDVVYTKALSDQGQPICLGVVDFEGHKIGR